MPKKSAVKPQNPVRSSDIRLFFSKPAQTTINSNEEKKEDDNAQEEAVVVIKEINCNDENINQDCQKSENCGENGIREAEKDSNVDSDSLEALEGENVPILSPPSKKRKTDNISGNPSPNLKLNQSNIVKSPNYEIIEELYGGQKVQHLYIFDAKDKTLGYKYTWSAQKRRFRCNKCDSKNIFVWAELKKMQNGESYVELGPKKHRCDIQDLVKTDKKSSKYRNFIIQGTKRVEYSDFKLVKRSIDGTILIHLAIFDPIDKNLCYEYKWNMQKHRFECDRCMKDHKTSVYANLFRNENYEKCLNLGKTSHKCKMIEFVRETLEMDQIKSDDYQLVKRKYKNRISQHLIIFDKNDKTLCYDLTWSAREQQFKCYSCFKQQSLVWVKLIMDESGELHIREGPQPHKCSLQKFVPEDPSIRAINQK